jgi:cobalt-zinc-cadmium efflux system membrane fusion protein
MKDHQLNRITIALLLAALGAGLAGCSHKSDDATGENTPQKTIVETVTVHPQTILDRLTLPAQVAPDPTRVVHIYPPLSGRVLNLYVRPGMEVKKGQPIALLQSGDLAQARSDFEKARIEADRSDLQLDRAKQLLAHQVYAQKDYDDLKAADEAAHSELERARQRIHELGFSEKGTSDETTLTAPISGAILDIGTATGELQRSLDNATDIATIANLDTVWVLGDVYEQDLKTVKLGADVDVTIPAYPGKVLHGKIDNISDAFDPTTRTLKARVVLPNPDHLLKPQMFAQISMVRSSKTGYELPTEAVLREGPNAFVFVQTAPQKYERRAVTVGDTHGDKTEVLSGLNDGDAVVTTGAALLREPVQGD